MKRKLYRPVFFSLYDFGAIARYLEVMAAKGWLPDRLGNVVWRFRPVPPQRLRFEVVFFPDASGFDPGPTEELHTMLEYCARDGWTLLAQWGQAQILVNREEDPVPIETDPVTQVKVLHKAMRRTMLPANFLLVGIILFQLWMEVQTLLRDPVEFLCDSFRLGMLPFWLLLLGAQAREITAYFGWLRRARRAAENGVLLASRPRRTSWWLLGLALLLLICSSLGQGSFLAVWCGCTALIVLLVRLVQGLMKQKGASREVNRAVTIGLCVLLFLGATSGAVAVTAGSGLFSSRAPETYQYGGHTFRAWQDPIPLRVEELALAEGIQYSTRAERKETFLLARSRFSQEALLTQPPEAPELSCTIVEVKARVLFPLCRDFLLEEDPLLEEEYRPAEAGPWGAEEAFRLYRHGEPLDRYLLVFPGRMGEVRSRGLELTPEQMAAIGAALKTAA